MKISLKYIFCAFALVASVSALAKERVYKAADFGIRPNTKQSQSALMQKAIDAIRAEMKKGDKAVLLMEEGRYDFIPQMPVVVPTMSLITTSHNHVP